MSFSVQRSLLLLLIVGLLSSSVAAAASKPFGSELSESSFTQKFLTGRSLDAVEGVWNIKGGNLTFQLAISRNTTGGYSDYDYLGVFLQSFGSPMTYWSNGDFCLGLKKSADAGFNSGFWLIPNLLWTDKFATPVSYVAASDTLQLTFPAAFSQTINLTASRSGQTPAAAGRSGSGFFITSSLVVTCAHLVEGASQISVEFHGDSKLPASRIAVDRVNDLALLRVSGLEVFVTPLALAPARGAGIGERVYAAAFPTPVQLGRSLKFSDGIVNSLNGLADDPRAFQISISVPPGASGGPLLNGKGQVTGIVINNQALGYFFYKGQTIPDSAQFAIKSSALSALLNSLGDSERYSVGDAAAANLDLPQIAELAKNAAVLVEVK